MKKFLLIFGALLLNFLLLLAGLSFYTANEGLYVGETKTVFPFILFLFGCYLLPWYALNIHKLSKGMHLLTVGLISWSFLFVWMLLSFSGGYFSGLLHSVAFIGSVVLPITTYHLISWKERTLQKKQETRFSKETKTETQEENLASSLEEIQEKIDALKQVDIKEKGEEILVLLKTILDNQQTLDIEEKHIINRLVSSELTQLFHTYLLLNKEKQEEMENDIIPNLESIIRYLHSVIDGVSEQYVKEMKTNLQLIQQRYQK